MSKKLNTQVAVICEDDKLYGCLKRALEASEKIKVDRFTNDSLKNKNIIVLLATPKEEDIREIVYSKIRSRYLNSIAIIGDKDRDFFKREHLLFRDHPFNHLYIDVPFKLEKFVAALWDMIPISSQAIKEAICGSDLGYKSYLLKLLSHDLLSKKERCVEILSLVGDYLKDKQLSKEIEAVANKIKMESSDWPAIASKIGRKLENRIKEVGMSKILCIDDEPDVPKIANKTLRQILHDIYNTSPYEVIFETDGDKGIEIAVSDKETKLVLLDIEFKGKQKKQGDMIAKKLLKVRPELKVIVLTRFTETGKKISFGHKRNVVYYVIKEETASPDIQNKVKNLSNAIIEDYENKGWQLEYDSPETITLYNGKESYGINIPITAQEALGDCIQSPNSPVSLSDSSNLNKAHNMINNNVREGTGWKTWGIITREGCAKGQLKLMIGSVISSQAHQTPKDPYVTQSQFEMFMKEINDKLSKIEERLFNKKSEEKAAKLL